MSNVTPQTNPFYPPSYSSNYSEFHLVRREEALPPQNQDVYLKIEQLFQREQLLSQRENFNNLKEQTIIQREQAFDQKVQDFFRRQDIQKRNEEASSKKQDADFSIREHELHQREKILEQKMQALNQEHDNNLQEKLALNREKEVLKQREQEIIEKEKKQFFQPLHSQYSRSKNNPWDQIDPLLSSHDYQTDSIFSSHEDRIDPLLISPTEQVDSMEEDSFNEKHVHSLFQKESDMFDGIFPTNYEKEEFGALMGIIEKLPEEFISENQNDDYMPIDKDSLNESSSNESSSNDNYANTSNSKNPVTTTVKKAKSISKINKKLSNHSSRKKILETPISNDFIKKRQIKASINKGTPIANVGFLPNIQNKRKRLRELEFDALIEFAEFVARAIQTPNLFSQRFKMRMEEYEKQSYKLFDRYGLSERLLHFNTCTFRTQAEKEKAKALYTKIFGQNVISQARSCDPCQRAIDNKKSYTNRRRKKKMGWKF